MNEASKREAPRPKDGESAAEERGERLAVLAQLEDWLETPMQILGFVWLGTCCPRRSPRAGRRVAQPREACALPEHGSARLRLRRDPDSTVTVAGAAGMYAFEKELPGGGGLADYSTALWWTAMVMTTLGSEYWPRTVEGRVLCFLLSLYAFAVWGYITASLATFFLGATPMTTPTKSLANGASSRCVRTSRRSARR
jgi:hypothetical protein